MSQVIDPKTGKAILTRADYEKAAQRLGVEPEAIEAVAIVESNGNGFQRQRDGTVAPVILFEKHWFGRYTGYKYNKSHPDISSKSWQPGTYGASLDQHLRLQKAVKLDRDAALKSCSWGKFQLMGGEYKENGYKSLQEFINDMYESEQKHLEGFINFILRKPQLLPALKAKNWATFAYYYNGPGYKKNAYHLKMSQEYAKLKRKYGKD